MDKVWCVVDYGYDYDRPDFLAIFTTREEAFEYLKQHDERHLPWNGRCVISLPMGVIDWDNIKSEEDQ